MDILKLIVFLSLSILSHADTSPIPRLYESVSYRDTHFILMNYLTLYDLAEKNKAEDMKEALRLNIESNAYYLIQIRPDQENISEVSRRVDCRISKNIAQLIMDGKIFTGKQEFSYKPEQAKDLLPKNCKG